MPSYDELKEELTRIAALLEKFPEDLRPNVYELLVSQFLGSAPPSPKLATQPAAVPKESTPPAKKTAVRSDTNQTGKAKRSGAKESYSIDRSLNLRGDKSIPSFKDFQTEKAPKSAKEFNAVAVYYLRKVLGLQTVTLNHAYTCYAEAGTKPPKAFRQSFIDAKNKEGWVEFDDAGNLEIPHRGSVFVEHDLPRPEKPTKSK